MEPITSRQNAHFRKLQDLHERKERKFFGQFLVEGEKEIALTKAIDTLYYAEYTPFVREMEKKSTELIAMAPELLEKVSYRGTNALAVCKAELTSLEALKNSTFLVACEGIEKPGNLGAILRTADGAGIEGVIVADPVVDVFNPNVVRASLGALFCLPVVQTDTESAVDFLRYEKIQIVVTSPQATKLYHEVDFTKPTCIVIGAESQGLSSAWLENENCIPVKIPMHGEVDSLNASISASIVIYEALRQRSAIS